MEPVVYEGSCALIPKDYRVNKRLIKGQVTEKPASGIFIKISGRDLWVLFALEKDRADFVALDRKNRGRLLVEPLPVQNLGAGRDVDPPDFVQLVMMDPRTPDEAVQQAFENSQDFVAATEQAELDVHFANFDLDRADIIDFKNVFDRTEDQGDEGAPVVVTVGSVPVELPTNSIAIIEDLGDEQESTQAFESRFIVQPRQTLDITDQIVALADWNRYFVEIARSSSREEALLRVLIGNTLKNNPRKKMYTSREKVGGGTISSEKLANVFGENQPLAIYFWLYLIETVGDSFYSLLSRTTAARRLQRNRLRSSSIDGNTTGMQIATNYESYANNQGVYKFNHVTVSDPVLTVSRYSETTNSEITEQVRYDNWEYWNDLLALSRGQRFEKTDRNRAVEKWILSDSEYNGTIDDGPKFSSFRYATMVATKHLEDNAENITMAPLLGQQENPNLVHKAFFAPYSRLFAEEAPDGTMRWVKEKNKSGVVIQPARLWAAIGVLAQQQHILFKALFTQWNRAEDATIDKFFVKYAPYVPLRMYVAQFVYAYESRGILQGIDDNYRREMRKRNQLFKNAVSKFIVAKESGKTRTRTLSKTKEDLMFTSEQFLQNINRLIGEDGQDPVNGPNVNSNNRLYSTELIEEVFGTDIRKEENFTKWAPFKVSADPALRMRPEDYLNSPTDENYMNDKEFLIECIFSRIWIEWYKENNGKPKPSLDGAVAAAGVDGPQEG